MAVVVGALLVSLLVPAVPAVISDDGDEVTEAMQTVDTALFGEPTESYEDGSGDDDGEGADPSDEDGDESTGAQDDAEAPAELDGEADTNANQEDSPPVDGGGAQGVTDDEQDPEETTDADGDRDSDEGDAVGGEDGAADDDGSAGEPEDGEDNNGESRLDADDRGQIEPDVVESMMFSLVNDLRSDEGMAELEWNAQAYTAAAGHAADMAEHDYFSHTALDGESAQERYGFCVGGENLAQTWVHRNVITRDGTQRITTNDELAVNVVQIWMNSEPHRERGIYGSWTGGAATIEITEEGKAYAVFAFCR